MLSTLMTSGQITAGEAAISIDVDVMTCLSGAGTRCSSRKPRGQKSRQYIPYQCIGPPRRAAPDVPDSLRTVCESITRDEYSDWARDIHSVNRGHVSFKAIAGNRPPLIGLATGAAYGLAMRHQQTNFF